jgi:hypothetical protein
MKYKIQTVSSALLIAGLVASMAPLSLFAENGANTEQKPKPVLRTLNASSTPPRSGEIEKRLQEIRLNAKEKIQEIKLNAKDEKGKIKDERRQEAEKQIAGHISKMTERFNAAVKRLDVLIMRLESRIAKVKAAGKDTSVADPLIADAKANITQAELDIAKIPGLVTTSLQASTTLVGKFNDLKNLSDTINKELRTAHKDLEKAIGALKGLRLGELEGNDDRKNASSTEQ